jgi:hypothetical protein
MVVHNPLHATRYTLFLLPAPGLSDRMQGADD